jgi:hypothetical protein
MGVSSNWSSQNLGIVYQGTLTWWVGALVEISQNVTSQFTTTCDL